MRWQEDDPINAITQRYLVFTCGGFSLLINAFNANINEPLWASLWSDKLRCYQSTEPLPINMQCEHRKLGMVSREHLKGAGCSVDKLLEVCQDIISLFVKFGSEK